MKNLKCFNHRVDKKSENIFNDYFWEDLNIVVSAVDNFETRLYLDEKCVFYEKPLFNSGKFGG